MYGTVGDLALLFETKTNEIPLATRLFPRQRVTSSCVVSHTQNCYLFCRNQAD